jgi:hypothetical protein
VCICGFAKVLSLQTTNRKSAKCHICGRPANLTNFSVCKFADLRIAELICGPPTFVFVVFMHAFYQCLEGLGFIEAEQEELGPGSGHNAERCMLKFCPSGSYHHD